MQSATGYDTVPFSNLTDHFFMFLGLFLLGPDHQEIHDGKDEDEGEELGEFHFPIASFRSAPLLNGEMKKEMKKE